MSIPTPTHVTTCSGISTIKSLGGGLDQVVSSVTIQVSTSVEVSYTETQTNIQYPVQTGTEEETYTKTEYTAMLTPDVSELTEVTEGTEVFREAIPKTKIGDVVTATREVPVFDIPEAITTTQEIDQTKTFKSVASFVVSLDVSSIDASEFISYSDLTEEVVIGWARSLAEDTFTEAETKNASKVSKEADMFLHPDKYVVDIAPLPW